jgi:hypothetical protein
VVVTEEYAAVLLGHRRDYVFYSRSGVRLITCER